MDLVAKHLVVGSLWVAACATDVLELPRQGAALDVHLHLASQALTDLFTGGGVPAPKAEGLIALLDEAQVDKGIVLGAGYMAFPDESYVAPENDYVSEQVSEFPERLIGFCGINPHFAGAPDEVSRCLDLPGMMGVKLHLPGSMVDLGNEADVAALAAVLDRTEQLGAPVMLHVGDAWSLPLENAEFVQLAELIDAHPTLRITHAHCAGNTDDADIERWLRVEDSGWRDNAFVDTSACLKFYKDAPLAKRELMVWRFRKWGMERVLFGSDFIEFKPEETPREALETLRQYPFSDDELETILSNDGQRWLEP